MSDIKRMKVITLADHYMFGASPKVQGEHGLSLFVEWMTIKSCLTQEAAEQFFTMWKLWALT